jgi:Alpha/beta hydrolase domain
MNMRRSKSKLFNYLFSVAAVICTAVSWSSPSDAFVQQLILDQTATVSFKPIPLGTSAPGPSTSYTVYQGRIFGALDPHSLHNTIITDIDHAPTTAGKVGYIANFQIVTPTNAAERSGLLIYEVSNRGGNAISTNSLVQGATYVQSGWQGDLLAECSLQAPAPYPCVNLNSGPYGTLNTTTGAFTAPKVPVPVIPGTTQLTSYVIQVPVATTDGKAPNGKNTITGPVYSHIPPGTADSTAQLIIGNSPDAGSAFTPYQPASLDTSKATLWSETSQTLGGVDTDKTIVPSSAWSWAYCPGGSPATPNTTWICLNGGDTFDPNRLYEIVFKAANPLVLGIGYAATRDLVSFLRHQTMAPGGGSNPISGTVTKTLGIGSSQSGAFLRALTFYGMNEDEDRHIVFDGIWPMIDGRMLWLNERFAQPTVLLQLYMGGEEAPVWWADFPNEARHLPPNGLLHLCTMTRTCPQVLETFGELEFYGEKMGPDMTGYCVVCRFDIPKPGNVYRYYLPGTSHGGSISAGSFNWSPPPTTLPVNSGQMYPSNPNGENYTSNALQAEFIAFLMGGTPMPPSVPGGTYPTLSGKQLVPNTQADEGFPDIPVFAFGGNNAWPAIVYNFGFGVNYEEETGAATIQPPLVEQVLTPYVPRVNSDGNDDVGSVPSVLFQAPLGTYVGWNIIPSPSPYAGQQDSLSGGYWPFQETIAARMAAEDPRPSLEERYGTHAGYVCVVTEAANSAIEEGFLLVSDASTLVADASGSNVLEVAFTPTPTDANLANQLCSPASANAITATGPTY